MGEHEWKAGDKAYVKVRLRACMVDGVWEVEYPDDGLGWFHRDRLVPIPSAPPVMAGAVTDEMVERCKVAVEGECDGHAISDKQARSIIEHIWSGDMEATESKLISVNDYAHSYEFRDPDYTPNDQEKTLIEDAITGYLGLMEEAGLIGYRDGKTTAALSVAPGRADGWMPIDEANHEDGQRALLWADGSDVEAWAWDAGLNRWHQGADHWWAEGWNGPTHFHELPAPPSLTGETQNG